MKIISILIMCFICSIFIGYISEAKEKKNNLDPGVVQFWSSFQTAMKNSDKEKVADMISFPLINETNEEESLSRVQFIKYFSLIFEGNDIAKRNNIKNLRKSYDEGTFDYEELGGMEKGYVRLRICIKKINGNYKIGSIFLRYQESNWPKCFEEALKNR